jgi:hypothetical protein
LVHFVVTRCTFFPTFGMLNWEKSGNPVPELAKPPTAEPRGQFLKKSRCELAPLYVATRLNWVPPLARRELLCRRKKQHKNSPLTAWCSGQSLHLQNRGSWIRIPPCKWLGFDSLQCCWLWLKMYCMYLLLWVWGKQMTKISYKLGTLVTQTFLHLF